MRWRGPRPAPGVHRSAGRARTLLFWRREVFTRASFRTCWLPRIASAIQDSPAVKICVSNLMTQSGETDGYSSADHVAGLPEVPAGDRCVCTELGQRSVQELQNVSEIGFANGLQALRKTKMKFAGSASSQSPRHCSEVAKSRRDMILTL